MRYKERKTRKEEAKENKNKKEEKKERSSPSVYLAGLGPAWPGSMLQAGALCWGSGLGARPGHLL